MKPLFFSLLFLLLLPPRAMPQITFKNSTYKEQYLRRSLYNRKQILGASHPEVNKALKKLIKHYKVQSKYSQAEAKLGSSIVTVKKIQDVIHNNIVILLYQDILEMRMNNPSSQHLDLLRSQTNLIKLTKKVLEMEQRQICIESPTNFNDTKDMNQLTKINEMQLPNWEFVRQGKQHRTNLGEKNRMQKQLEMADNLIRIAKKCITLGMFSKATWQCKFAMNIREKFLGINHLAIAECLEVGAIAYQKMKFNAKARKLFERALRIRSGECILKENEFLAQEDLKKIGTDLNTLPFLVTP